MSGTPVRHAAWRSPLPVVLCIAFVIRVVIALRFHNIIGPDEVFQSLEQAHRLIFGQGIVPWEFAVGLRCWLIPLTLAIPMALAHLLDPNPIAGLIFIRILLCIASLSIVACAVKWGEALHGTQGAWIAGLFTALWPDLWLMAPHPLEEVFAADLLVPAVYLVGTAGNLRRVAAAAFLLGLAFTLRLQLAPAIAIAGIVLCQRDPRRWALALAVAALPVLAAGLLDWFTWGQPFRSFWLNIYMNVFLGIAKNEFGASPPAYFLYMLGLDWLWTLPVILYLAWRGGRELKLAGAMALIIIVTHTLISHKEYRFIFPAIALAVPLAGIGLAGLCGSLQKAGLLVPQRLVLGLILLLGPLISPFVYFMLGLQSGSFSVFERLTANPPSLVSLQGWDYTFHSFLPVDIVFNGATKFTRQTITPSPDGPIEADAIVATKPAANIPANFSLQACYLGNWIPFSHEPRRQICIWRRAAGPAVPPNAAAPPFILPLPKAAAPFIIRDRLEP